MIGKIGGNMNRKGQALIEFVLILPILIMLIFAVIDFGKAVIASDENASRYSAEVVKTIGSIEDEEEIAHNLYGILREFDETEVKEIYSESFEGDGIRGAIMNRLLKAAGHKVINADKEAITRIIFAGKNGSSRSPMASYILKSMDASKDYEILSRGILVQFPEPLNPKVEAVLASNGIEVGDFHAVELTDNDINSSTITFETCAGRSAAAVVSHGHDINIQIHSGFQNFSKISC